MSEFIIDEYDTQIIRLVSRDVKQVSDEYENSTSQSNIKLHENDKEGYCSLIEKRKWETL